MEWTRSQMPRLVGLSARQLIRLSRNGIFQPSINPRGQGVRTIYTDDDVRVLAAIAEVTSVVGEINQKMLEGAVEALHSRPGSWDGLYLMIDRERSFVIDIGSLKEILAEDSVLVVPLGRVADRLRRNMMKVA